MAHYSHNLLLWEHLLCSWDSIALNMAIQAVLKRLIPEQVHVIKLLHLDISTESCILLKSMAQSMARQFAHCYFDSAIKFYAKYIDLLSLHLVHL